MQLVEQKYKKLSNNDFSFLSQNVIPESELTSLLVIYDFCKRDKSKTVNFFINEYYGSKVMPDLAALTSGLLDFLNFFDKIEFDPEHEQIINLCATIYLKNYQNKLILEGHALPKLPSSPIEGSIYLDLVTGTDFINFYPQLSEKYEYWFIDKSQFALKCLEKKKADYPFHNIRLFNKDVRNFTFPTSSKKVGLIRAKNVFCYVDDFKSHLNKYSDMLESGGMFIFQEQSLSSTISNPIYQDIESYFNGWKKETKFDDPNNPLALDSIIFIKP